MAESRNQKHKVIFIPSGRRDEIDDGVNLKEASEKLGVGIEGTCSQKGTCGKCKVRIEEGVFEKYHIDSSGSHLTPINETEKESLSVIRRRGKVTAWLVRLKSKAMLWSLSLRRAGWQSRLCAKQPERYHGLR